VTQISTAKRKCKVVIMILDLVVGPKVQIRDVTVSDLHQASDEKKRDNHNLTVKKSLLLAALSLENSDHKCLVSLYLVPRASCNNCLANSRELLVSQSLAAKLCNHWPLQIKSW
jgi:hypothetical protein